MKVESESTILQLPSYSWYHQQATDGVFQSPEGDQVLFLDASLSPAIAELFSLVTSSNLSRCIIYIYLYIILHNKIK